ncbi:hypothetical protein HO133_006852 [Letharia lupina]|uniref:Uncharacterized protein n=1 Tax=Letharia lupina TaxID=560253 RepID=A0A8H6C5Y0_9LECA|nr:uncharacterized protein HO133_006852 [Letharia lupina]KAF6217514.1 hypothetical protein HO133_006852 [Letharia lupina]
MSTTHTVSLLQWQQTYDLFTEHVDNTTKEMISELHGMFGDYDKLAKNDALLHDPAFTMKKKEAFNEFYARFSATIAPLDYSESHKIAALRRPIPTSAMRQNHESTTPPLSTPHHYFKHLPGLLPHIDTPVACVRRPAT